MDTDKLKQTLRDFANERDWDQFHSPKNLSMALSVEVAELVEHFQWLTESASHSLPAEVKTAVAEELADIQIYLIRLVDKLDVNLEAAIDTKLAANARKYPVEKVRGNAAKYTTYKTEPDE